VLLEYFSEGACQQQKFASKPTFNSFKNVFTEHIEVMGIFVEI
jgi:hypothetical protein